MKVSQLIGILNWMPKDFEVVSGGTKVDKVEIEYEWYDGDSANPECDVIPVVALE